MVYFVLPVLGVNVSSEVMLFYRWFLYPVLKSSSSMWLYQV